MKKISLIAMLLAGVGVNAADVSQYATFKLGYTSAKIKMERELVPAVDFFETKHNNGAGAFTVGYGLDFVDLFRWDFEYSYNTPIKKAQTKTKIMSWMFNGYYDLIGTEIKPYFMAGFGIARVHNTVSDPYFVKTVKGGNFAWQAGAGVAYKLDAGLALDLGYKYSDYGNNEAETITGMSIIETKNKAHTVSFGVRFIY